MMSDFGNIMLLLSTALILGAGVLSTVFLSDTRVDHTIKTLFITGALAAAGAVLTLAFLLVTYDYRVKYVFHNADSTMDTGFLITAVWGGQQGSLLFWAMIQTLFGVAAVLFAKKYLYDLFRPVAGIMSAISIFFLLLVFTQSNPFELAGRDAIEGIGMNPLLRNPYMVFHPPTLFIGFAGFSVPAAFALAALLTGKLNNRWLFKIRPFIIFAFAFLSIGNILGMVWAYQELGWGGYWGWDPVENASLIPWITGAALVHSSIVENRRNIFKKWNLFLIVSTYVLVIFGTFLTRSNIIQSVHTFSGATTGPFFLGFIVVLIISFIFPAVKRRRLLKAESQILLWSKEWFFEVANWLFISAASFVWLATMWPLFSALFQHRQIAVPPLFFNRWMVPMGLVLLLLLGFATGASWKKKFTVKNLWITGLSFISGLSVCIYMFVFKSGNLTGSIFFNYASLISSGLLVFVLLLLLFAIRRSVIKSNRVKLGGQIVHLGVVLMFLGFTGEGFTVQNQALLAQNEVMYVGDYKISFMGLRSDINYKREAVYADIEVTPSGDNSFIVSPSRFYYHSLPDQPTSEVSIKGGLFKDLFFILGESDVDNNRAIIKVLINPLVFFIWFGGVIMIIGMLIAVLKRGIFIRMITLSTDDFLKHKVLFLSVLFVVVTGVSGTIFTGMTGAIAGTVSGVIIILFCLLFRESRIFVNK